MGVAWDEVEHEEGFREKREEMSEGLVVRHSPSDRISESVEQDEVAMGTLGNAIRRAEAPEEVVREETTVGEDVKGHEKSVRSVKMEPTIREGPASELF